MHPFVYFLNTFNIYDKHLRRMMSQPKTYSNYDFTWS